MRSTPGGGRRGDRARHAAFPHPVPRQEQPGPGVLGRVRRRAPRFSGRPAPPREGAGPYLEFAEDQENFAVGFWTGGADALPLFYAYVVPQPDGLERAPVRPRAARWDGALGEFVLPYDELRRAASPEEDLLAFFQAAYEASADLGGWDRAALEGPVPALPGRPARPRPRASARRPGVAAPEVDDDDRRRDGHGPDERTRPRRRSSARAPRCRRRGSRSARSSPPT